MRKAKLNTYIASMYCGKCKKMEFHQFSFYGLYMNSYSELAVCLVCSNEYIIPLGEVE